MRQFLFVTFLLGLMSLPAVYFLGDVATHATPSRTGSTAAVPTVAKNADVARDPAAVVEDAIGVLHRVAAGLADSLIDEGASGEPRHGLVVSAGEVARDTGIEPDIGPLPDISGVSGRAERGGRNALAGAGTGRSVVPTLATVDNPESAGPPPRRAAPGLDGRRSSDSPGLQRASIDLATAYSGRLGLSRVHPTSITWFDLV
jgi:hypothetical protein